jgi:hypothetical protein
MPLPGNINRKMHDRRIAMQPEPVMIYFSSTNDVLLESFVLRFVIETTV